MLRTDARRTLGGQLSLASIPWFPVSYHQRPSVHSGAQFNAECLIIIHANVNTDKQANRGHYQSITA